MTSKKQIQENIGIPASGVTRKEEGTAREDRRTTIVLKEEDQLNLEKVAAIQGGISDVEAIRRSLNLAREILEWTKIGGGEIILQKGRRRERIRFL